MKLVHFSDAPVEAVRPTTAQESPRAFGKPNGFWLSDEAADVPWSTWCSDQEFRDTSRQLAHEITLAEAHGLLVLTSEAELREFDQRFGVRVTYRSRAIDWRAVAECYPGIVITPYVWACRMEFDWYYTWDVASACIWDPSCIASIARASTKVGGGRG